MPLYLIESQNVTYRNLPSLKSLNSGFDGKKNVSVKRTALEPSRESCCFKMAFRGLAMINGFSSINETISMMRDFPYPEI